MKQISLAALVIFFASCSPVFYAPISQNVPMFTEQGQGEFGIGQSYLLSQDNGLIAQVFELQTAYSFLEHGAAQVNYMALFSENDVRYNYVEGAFGYFQPLSEAFVFEVYPGVGFGNIRKNFSPLTMELSFINIFIQPSIGYAINGFEVALSTRIAYLNYYKNNHNIPLDDFQEFGLDLLEKEYVNIEPAISFGWRFKNTKLEMQWYRTTPISSKILPSYNRGTIISLSHVLKKRKQ